MNLNDFFLQLQNAQGGAILLQLLYFITWCAFILLLVWLVHKAINLALTDNRSVFNLRYVVNYKKRRFTKKLSYNAIRQAIEKKEGKVQLASATFEVVEWPAVKLQNKS